MVYSVVIIEDESVVLKEIVETTPWSELKLKVIGQAQNGIDGEVLIKEFNPDLVITDIRLPGKSGLDMLEDCGVIHSIVLSGYSDFSYARKAIQIGVFDYLLKPFDDEDFYDTLKKFVQTLEEEERDYHKLKNELINSDECENFLIKMAINYVRTNFSKNIGLQEVSDLLSVTDSYLSRLFKEETKVNFLQFLNAYRINQSLIMMQNPKLNINQIASCCGFTNSGYYSKIFKKIIGVSPSQFRDSLSLAKK
ncbi:MAG: helix-turn-helix domain-containing protein [Sphaerochaetaceae bacterium]|nr:helix-turn-helix domain-containing protein [Sphaerochaetaceae bacterium]